MKLRHLREAVRQESVIKIFSDLVTLLSDLSDLVEGDGMSGEDAREVLSDLLRRTEVTARRIGRLDMDEPTWESLSTSLSLGDHVDSWRSARAVISKRLLPEIAASARLVMDSSGQSGLAALRILQERVASTQAALTGAAPIGAAVAASVDETVVVEAWAPRQLPDDVEDPTEEGFRKKVAELRAVADGSSKDSILSFFRKVRKEVEDYPGSEFFTMPGGFGDSGNCSQSAAWMIQILGGDLVGWNYGTNDAAAIVKETDWKDHDFVVTDKDILVDFWYWFNMRRSGRHGVYDLSEEKDAAEATRLYGPRDRWSVTKGGIELYNPWGAKGVHVAV